MLAVPGVDEPAGWSARRCQGRLWALLATRLPLERCSLAPTTTIDNLETRALELAVAGTEPAAAVTTLVDAAAGDRKSLEEARNRVARRMHGNSGDLSAGAALALLNKALVSFGWIDPYNWKKRLGNRLRKP
jgi:hypothetical protein